LLFIGTEPGCRLRRRGLPAAPPRYHPVTRGPSLRCRAWHPGRHRGLQTPVSWTPRWTIRCETDPSIGAPPSVGGLRRNRPTGLVWYARHVKWLGEETPSSRAGPADRLVDAQPAPPSSAS